MNFRWIGVLQTMYSENTATTEKLSIVIPVYNEERTLGLLLEKVAAAPLDIPREVVIVNDGSIDSSDRIIKNFMAMDHDFEVKYLQRTNGGKGAAVRDGIAASSGSIIIIQDGDLEYEPSEYSRCIAPILADASQIVYGSRERKKGNGYSQLRFYLGGLAVTWMVNLLYFTLLTDEPTCYKVFRSRLIKALEFENDDFGWEPEVTCKLLRLGYKIAEVPVSYTPRHVAEGKKIRWQDGLKAFKIILQWRFADLNKFNHLRKKSF